MHIWKGCAPGSWWHTNDARSTGFYAPAVTGPNANAALRHITNAPHPSPFVSFSTSYAVAHDYATLGGTVTGGFIYEVDVNALPTNAVHDPVQLVATMNLSNSWSGRSGTGVPLAHAHDGSPMLIAAVA